MRGLRPSHSVLAPRRTWIVAPLTCTRSTPSIPNSAAANGAASTWEAVKVALWPDWISASSRKRIVMGSRSAACARILRLGLVSSDIFEIGCLHSAQRLEGVDSRTVAIAEGYADPVVADIPDPCRDHIKGHAFRIEQSLARHLVAAGRTSAGQPETARVKAHLAPVSPADPQPRVAIAPRPRRLGI